MCTGVVAVSDSNVDPFNQIPVVFMMNKMFSFRCRDAVKITVGGFIWCFFGHNEVARDGCTFRSDRRTE